MNHLQGLFLRLICILIFVSLRADSLIRPVAPMPGMEPSTSLQLKTVVKSPVPIEPPCTLEGDYRWYYPDNGLSYTRTFLTVNIRCDGNTLFFGDNKEDRKRLVNISGPDFEIEDIAIDWRIGFRFEISNGVVKGLRRTTNGHLHSEFYEFRKPIEANDEAITKLAVDFLQNAARRNLRPEIFTPDYAAELFPDSLSNIYDKASNFVKHNQFRIYKRNEEGDELLYAFLIVQGERAAVLHLRVTQDHQIKWAWLDTGSEDDLSTHEIARQFLLDACKGYFRSEIVETPSPESYLSKKLKFVLAEMQVLGPPIAINRTKRPGVAICYFVVCQNGCMTLELWLGKDGKINGVNLD